MNTNNDSLARVIESVWNMRANNIESKNALNKNGLLICKGLECPYRLTCLNPCDMSADGLAKKPPCPAELAVLIVQYANYCEAFGVKDNDAVDTRQIYQLVETEIKLLRCNKYTAVNPEIVYEIAEDGSGGKRLNPILNYELKLMDQHRRILKDLRVFD